MIVVQMLGLATTVAVDVAVGRDGEMHFFHGPSFGFDGLAAAIRDFRVFEQGLEPLQRCRGGRHTPRATRPNERLADCCCFQNESKRLYHALQLAAERVALTRVPTGYANTIEGSATIGRRTTVVCSRA